MPEQNKLHEGHRQRVKEKFLLNGLDNFNDHQVLEMLLFYAVPRRDTNELAHKLINKFGSFSAVLDAPTNVLIDCGLSQNAAVLLKLIPPISSLYINDKFSNEHKIITDDNIGDRIIPNFISAEDEQVLLLLLDAKGKELYCGIISKGSVNASEIYTRKIIQLAVKYNASGAILAHNHPSGVAIPSIADINTTKEIYDALNHINVLLADHIIIADGDGVSIAQSQLGEGIFYSCEE